MIEQPQLDFDAPAVSPAPGTPLPAIADTFLVGSSVYLRGCIGAGQPGRVLRLEKGRVVTLWEDLGPSFITRHTPASLMLAEVSATGNTARPVERPAVGTLGELLAQVAKEPL
jgi:hypothetical protein